MEESKIKIILLFALVILFTVNSCDSTEPPSTETIALKLEDVSCTETWITLTTTNLKLPATVTIKQNDQTRRTINLVKPDTLLYIDSLLPNQTYSFQSVIQSINQSSNELSVTTLDTTSHDFTFQTWTFGEHSSSVLYDVAIIDENNIWAVGEIYMNDSLGQPDPMPYNAVHWNGTSWVVTRIPTKTFSGTTVSSEIRTIFAFNENDIWTFSIAGSYSHWNGNNWETEFVSERDGSGNKLWGTSSSNLYLACNNGGITYYNGTSWQKTESGTDLNIYDIWGDYNNESDGYEIIAVAANIGVSFDKAILKINETGTATTLSSLGIPYSIHGIWFKAGREYYITGAGMFNKKDINSSNPWNELEITSSYSEAISGVGINDIVVCGHFAELLHFNGLSWKSYQDFSGVLLLGIKIKADQIIIVGVDSPKAFIAIGNRLN